MQLSVRMTSAIYNINRVHSRRTDTPGCRCVSEAESELNWGLRLNSLTHREWFVPFLLRFDFRYTQSIYKDLLGMK